MGHQNWFYNQQMPKMDRDLLWNHDASQRMWFGTFLDLRLPCIFRFALRFYLIVIRALVLIVKSQLQKTDPL